MTATAVGAPGHERDAAVLARQAARQKQALGVLDALRPLQRWERFGEPRLCGAMAYGLLVAPDIDIEVFGELHVDAGFSLVSEWARDPAVERLLFINAVGEPDAGLGWELQYRYEGERWAVQMWLLAADYDGPRSADLVAPMRAALRTTTQARILRIKEALVGRGEEYRSIDVYRSVLDGGVNDVEEYARWCRSYSSTGMINWRPSPPE
ncbi:hypothetical protein ABZ565_06925 [Streptomyces sp. NPDC016469]|uniref:hypothetical protein n=1 Tax=Streptomyces sp. NPDC016469 TaxID=3157191 RepID=UPI0033D65C34